MNKISFGEKVMELFRASTENCYHKKLFYCFYERAEQLEILTIKFFLVHQLKMKNTIKVFDKRIFRWNQFIFRSYYYLANIRSCLFSISGPSTFRERTHALWRLIKKKALELNLFETEASRNDDRRRHDEIITTYVYLLLLTIAITILVVYTAVTIQPQSFTTKYPSQSYVEQLVSNPRYSPTLQCPCQNILIP